MEAHGTCCSAVGFATLALRRDVLLSWLVFVRCPVFCLLSPCRPFLPQFSRVISGPTATFSRCATVSVTGQPCRRRCLRLSPWSWRLLYCFTRDCSCFSRQRGPLFFLLWTLLLAFMLLLPHPPATSPSSCARFYPVAFSLFFPSRVAFAAWWPTVCDVNHALLLLREMRCEKAMFRCEVDCKSPVTVSTGFSYQLPSGACPLAQLGGSSCFPLPPLPFFFFFPPPSL